MTIPTELLPLGEIVVPKAQKPNLVENIQDALANPVRTLRDYLFTSGIRGYFDRIFQDVKDRRGGGYWVQAEYGGGKTHFLSTLLCLLGEAGEEAEQEVWANVGDSDLRAKWESVVRPRRLLGAHMSLMGTTPVIGREQPRLVDLIDEAIVEALECRGLDDPGISAGAEILQTLADLDQSIRSVVETAFRSSYGMSVEEYRNELGDLEAAKAVIAVVPRGIKLEANLQVEGHFNHVLDRLQSRDFDGLIIVIDEYFSRQGGLSDQQALEDGTVLETIGYKLGRQGGRPVYLVVASQGEMPAKLKERIDPMALLRDQDREYSQIVCKRIMDYKPAVKEQAVLYHNYFSRNFQFLRRASETDTREIFPFQSAVFRYLRNLVGSDRVGHLPSARFAIGAAYDAIAAPGAMELRRFITTSDLMTGELEGAVATELRDAAAALRQARDFVDESEWSVASFPPMARRVLSHLFLHSMVSDQGQSADQIVEGTLIQDPAGMLLARQLAQAILRQMSNCEQIESRGDNWRFASRVTEGEHFETIFQKTRKAILRNDPRIDQKWTELLTAPVMVTAGVPTFLTTIVTPMRLPTDYCGVEYPGRAFYVQGNPSRHLTPLERLTQPERARIVVASQDLDSPSAITDPAIAVVVPGSLPESAVDEIRGLIACQDILDDYAVKVEPGTEAIRAAAEAKSRELTKQIVQRQREVYREGTVYTRDGLPLDAKRLFKDGLQGGLAAIAQQLVRAAYPEAPSVLSGSHAKRGTLASADAGKVFDCLFGGVMEAKTKGAAESFGPVLGLSTPREPTRLVWNADSGIEAVANFIAEEPGCAVADLYDRFCNEPYGLPGEVVDLWVFACVVLSKPHPLEVRTAQGVVLETRDRRPFSGPIRANQVRQLVWPKSLKGCTIAQSKETTWNDFAHVAQAIDPEQFSMTTDHREIETQEKALVALLKAMSEQVTAARNALSVLRDASGGEPDPAAVQALDRLAGLAAFHADFSREAALAYVSERWQDGNPALLKADIQKLNSLTSLVGEAARLSGRLSWFRQLQAAAPEAMAADIEMAAPLLTLGQITSGPGQLATGLNMLNELYAKFMARYRAEHSKYAAWLDEQRRGLERAEKRLTTLARLNQIAQLGPPELPTAHQHMNRLKDSLHPCERPDDPDVGNGLTCLSCRFVLGSLESQVPVGERAEEGITAAIELRAHSLSQGLIAEAIKEAGDRDLGALLVAAQAHKFKDIVADDLLSDELVKRVNVVLARAKQQTVPCGQVYDFIAQNPHITRENLDAWVNQLREVLRVSLEDTKKRNPGKEITLLLKAGDD